MSFPATREGFARDVAHHEMTVLLDQGTHRHLRFARVVDGKQSSFYWFEVVAWPGSLAIAGDCGSFVFSCLRDMFRFFRASSEGDRINPGYWSEKLQAVDSGYRSGSDGYARQYSYERFVERVNEWRDDQWREWQNVMDEEEEWLSTNPYGPMFAGTRRRRRKRRARDEVRNAFFSAVRELTDDPWGDHGVHHSEERAHKAISEFTFSIWSIPYDQSFAVDLSDLDTWEWDLRAYDHRFLWNCWAIVHAIRCYDEAKRAAAIARAAAWGWKFPSETSVLGEPIHELAASIHGSHSPIGGAA